MKLSDYKDIHTHNMQAGADAIINLPFGADVPESGSYSVGIHPWDTADATADDIERLARLAANDRVVAIGETGIDMLRGASVQRQTEIFKRHVALSESLGKPLIIHAVRSLHLIMQLRKQLRPKQLWVIHGFRGNPVLANQLIAMGIDISIGPNHHRDIPAAVDPAHLHHETD